MGDSKKFARTTNFTAREENVLLSLVKKYKELIESKKTDTNTNKIKGQAWINLGKEYNSICAEYHRDVKTLRNKYENIKKRTKQKFADQKKYITGTGGGPEKDIVVTTVDNDMFEIIGTQLTGRPSEFDDDTVAETIQITTSDSGRFETTNMDTDCDVPSEKKDELPNVTPTSSKGQHKEGTWAKYTPAMLQAPKNKHLITQNKGNEERPKRAVIRHSLGYRLKEWTYSKIALAEMQQKCFLEEHNLKLTHMKEQHPHHLQHQDRDAEERSYYLKKEHEMRIELLELEKQALKRKNKK